MKRQKPEGQREGQGQGQGQGMQGGDEDNDVEGERELESLVLRILTLLCDIRVAMSNKAAAAKNQEKE